MDIVDTFNHLIPSDQLDDSLLLGQNLESEASDEFGPSHHLLEDSLKNMLSDKDPMLGSASTQFHLLDNDEANFEIAGSTGLEMMNDSESGHGDAGDQVTRPKSQRGRPKGASRATRKTSCEVVAEPTETVSSLASHSGPVDKPTTSKASGKSAKRGLKQQEQEPVEGQEEPDNFSQDKTGELPESGISHQQIEQSMNPVVVLRRLTVTVGGYKIELLPGPSKTSETAAATSALAQTAAPSLGLQQSTASPGDLDLPVAQDQAVNTPCTAAEAVDDLTAVQDLGNGCIDEATTELGPYVNPNEVQEGPGVLLSSLNMADVSTAESNPGDQTDTLQANSGSAIKPDVDSTRDEGHIVHPTQMDKAAPLNAPADKESLDQKVLANKQLKSKQLPSSAKQKKLVPNKSNKPGAEPKTAQQNKVARSDIPDMQAVKEKQAIVVAKRRSEHLKTYPPSKMQRMQDGKPVKPLLLPGTVQKSPDPSRQVVKRPLTSSTSPDSIRAQPPGVSKALRSQFGPRAHNPQATVVKPGLLLREHSEEDEQERLKTKKAEKALQRQKSKGNRGLSVDEPPLFIPDNAPVVKKEAHEDDSTDSETVWDPSKHCGFCKKPHNNRFMVGCGRCDDWFHGECVGLDLAKAQQMEQEDQEYVCLKCCAKEDRKVESEAQGQSSTEAQIKPENPQENKLAFKHERHGSQLPATAGGRMFRKDSIERKQSADVKDADQKGGRMKPPQTSGDPVHKTVAEKQEMKKTKSSPAASKKPSVEQIRRNVRDSLKDILLKRLNESNLKVSVDRAANVATKTEKELFSFFRDTDSKYKSKYRSLMFNLKDVKNHVLFKRVLKGEITPDHLIRMSPEELASKELAAWRQRENRHTIEMIEKEQREVDRRPITKITHKGEIEIENQEPVKEPEAAEVELEPVAKPLEEPEVPPQETELESAKDTTSQHKAHLFDLNCKICTGRMAPPVEDSATKVVKVATSVMRRQSSTDVEGQNNGATSQGEELLLSAVEDVLVSPRAFSDGRSGNANSREDETTFLNRLESLWKGFVNMPSVAKFVTKAYPVSGIMDHLTEDLPDSIQVGGRISPQTVWDYVEKIRASGTKEVCLIRFAPVTEEDEISYTLLYAYFSSRKRYGVVANNMKQVKDMYLIPLGSSEKIPHQLVPFDGPGLETNRSNLLLGLIIRQRVKRDFGVILPVEIPEASTSRFLPESRTKLESSNESGVPHEEKGYLNSLNVVQHTEAAKPQHSSPDVAKLGMLPVEKSSSASDVNLLEPTKPLRFLPGVLVGWEGQSPPAADVASRPSPAGEVPQSGPGASEKDAEKQGTAGDGATKGNASNRSPASNGSRLDRFIIKKKEPKPAKCEPLSVSPQKKPDSQDSPVKQSGNDAGTANLLLSLKDKPPDVSTEAFFATLTTGQAAKGPEKAVVQSQEDSKPEDGQPFSVSATVSSSPVEDISKPQGFLSPAKSQRQSMGGILKNSSTLYKSEMQVSSADPKSSHTEEKGPMQEHSDAATHQVSLEHPEALNADKQSSPHPVAAQHGRSYEPQSEYKPLEDIQSISTVSSFGKAEDHVPRPGLRSPPEAVFSQGGHRPPPSAPTFPPVQAAAPEFQYQPVPVFQVQANAAPPFQPPPQQAPPSFSYPGPAPLIFPQLDPPSQHHTAPWPPTAAPPAGFPPSQQAFEMSRFTESSKPAPPATRDDKGPERRYSDPWERQPRHPEDGYKSGGSDHYARQRHYSESHPDRKGRHHERDHERERGKHWEHQSEKGGQRDRSRSRSRSREDKHRDSRSRHPSHSGGDHHTDRWKERRHTDRDREREKDKHRRDSDYDKGRKSSKDGRT